MANFIPREKIETPFILILIGDKSKNISKYTMNSIISMNSSDANTAGEKRDRSETDDNGVAPYTPAWYKRFEEWRDRHVDDPSLPPIQVLSFCDWVLTDENITPFPTEDVLRATFEKYGPVTKVLFGMGENVSSPNFGKPVRAQIKFARQGDSALARAGENWRRYGMKEKQEREALLVPLSSSPPQ